MVAWKAPYHGATEDFLRALVGTQEQGCIEWPYARTPTGHGIATVNGIQRSANNWMCRLAHGEPRLLWKHAAHSCHNPACVNPKHLRWATHAENMADKEKDGTTNRGERNGKTTISEDDVRAIRAAPPFLGPLMEKYGLSRHAVSKIRSGKRWGHVKTEPAVRIGQQSHCRNGHAYDEANTRWANGYRQCRACDRVASKRRRQQRNAA